MNRVTLEDNLKRIKLLMDALSNQRAKFEVGSPERIKLNLEFIALNRNAKKIVEELKLVKHSKYLNK